MFLVIIPLFPLPEVVLFPGMNLPLHIFEDRYKKMISKSLEKDKIFGIVFAKENTFSEVGTIAKIIDVEKFEDGKMNILIEGKSRFKIISLVNTTPYYEAEILDYEDIEIKLTSALKKTIKEIREMSSHALSIFDLISDQEVSKKLPATGGSAFGGKLPSDLNELLFLVAANLTCSFEEKQIILETRSIKERSEKIMPLLEEEIERLEVLLENKETKKDVIKNGKLKI